MREHTHEYRPDIADWWCLDCQTVTDYCTDLGDVAPAVRVPFLTIGAPGATSP